MPGSNQSCQGELRWRYQPQGHCCPHGMELCRFAGGRGLVGGLLVQGEAGFSQPVLSADRHVATVWYAYADQGWLSASWLLHADSRAAQMHYQHLAAAGQGGLQVEGLQGQQGLPGDAEAQQMAWEPEPPPTGRRRKQRTTQGALAPLQVGCTFIGPSVIALWAARFEPAAAGRQLEQKAAQECLGTLSGGFWHPATCLCDTRCRPTPQAGGASRGGCCSPNLSATP